MKQLVIGLIAAAALAGAAPAHGAVINVRIEGRVGTLFEGPIETTGRNVQAVSERAAGLIRKCDGTNNGRNPTRVPTPTSSAVDAMSIVGQGFEGRWYGNLEDYFIRGFGSDLDGNGAYWGVFVDGTSSPTGGCQRALAEGANVLWVYDAFSGRPQLSLAGPQTASPGQTVTYQLGQANGQSPQPYSTAVVASEPAAATSAPAADGSVQVTFGGPGWYRLKASGAPFVRSNRVYVCVNPCGAQPADRAVRIPPAPVFYGPGGRVVPDSPALARTLARPRLSKPSIKRSGYRRGRIAVDWRKLVDGVGLLRWTIASDDLSSKGRRFVTRARGSAATSASLRLPAGRVHALRFVATDRLLRDETTDFGRVLVPIDDRAKQVKRRGSWRKARSSSAWKGTLLRGGRGARITVRLAAGRPAVVLGGRGRAVVRIGSKTLSARGGRTLLGPKRRKAGRVTITVIRGSISLDGVAASP